MPVEPAVARLQELVRIPTISRVDETAVNWLEFERFIATLEKLYPLVHEHLECERVAGHSLLFRWAGRSPGNPAVLMGHYDVVPATDEGWDHPAFGAEVTGEGDERVLWGRGTIDDKGAVVSILEGVEARLRDGFQPEHDVYLSFGHNEETTGEGGAAAAALLRERRIRPALVLDEGGAVVEGIFPGVTDPIAVVGVSEKGTTNVHLTVDQVGGHASTPPRMTATVRLARAITRLNRRPFPARFSPANLEMIRTVGAHATQPLRFVFTQLWLTRLPLLGLFTRLGDETNAMTRTTQAVTMLSASDAENALAETATANVNVRVAVGSSVADAVAHIRRAIHDDDVRVEVVRPNEPSPMSPSTGPAW
ncbi:MAG: M20/M25/M40 family metallo-hydrolase, partial [Rhodoglobus sp.]